LRQKGRISAWKDSQGYGFITPVGEKLQVFLHVSELEDRQRRPAVGEIVTYELGRDERGRAQARAVRRSSVAAPARQESSLPSSGAAVFSAVFLLVLTGLAITGRLHFLVPVVYLGMGLVTFLAYAFDKSAALNRRWRTSESTLLVLGLLGGWPGALLAQRMFRHKSAKSSFQAAFWITVVLNLTVLLLVAFPEALEWISRR
jgi:uncharacterized membrane protein YsdA (DUF1294 family)/cold shock CspA family protein